jgi:hypothetical protein
MECGFDDDDVLEIPCSSSPGNPIKPGRKISMDDDIVYGGLNRFLEMLSSYRAESCYSSHTIT